MEIGSKLDSEAKLRDYISDLNSKLLALVRQLIIMVLGQKMYCRRSKSVSY